MINMRNQLKQLHDQMFGEQFRQFLKKSYEKDVSHGEFDECEQEYTVACTWFAENWSEEQREILRRIEKLQVEKRNYAGEYAFCCGMSVAFEQLFTGKKELRFDFSERLDRGLYEVEGMKRHPYYYRWACEVREAYDGLGAADIEPVEEDDDDLSEAEKNPEQEHLTSHECGWDQRICSGAVAAYYLGYRLALEVIERVRPMATQNMMDQILMIEYQLGVTLSAAERERMKGTGDNECQMKAC